MIRLAVRLLVRIVLLFFFGRIILGGIDLREERFQLTQWKIESLSFWYPTTCEILLDVCVG